jgi:tight adherence protein C
MTTPDALFALASVFIAVAITTGTTLLFLLTRLNPERRRLAQVAGSRTTIPLDDMLLDTATQPSAWARWLAKSPKEMGRLRRRLAAAGYTSPWLAMAVAIAEIVTPLVVASVPLLVVGGRRGLLLAVIAGILGWLMPGLALDHLVRRRQRRIRNGLPDALDLLIVCVEAGNGLDQAIVKASEELDVSHPEVAGELRAINLETRAGKPRLEAFRNFADRTRVDDVRSLVSMLVQTDRFGTSVAQALRTFADVLRTKRRQRAEERAAKLGVKLVIPLVFFLFPALYVVTLGPAVIQYVRVFKAHVHQK